MQYCCQKLYTLYFDENLILGVFKFTDFDFDVQISKFEMTDPIWPLKIQKLMFFYIGFQFIAT